MAKKTGQFRDDKPCMFLFVHVNLVQTIKNFSSRTEFHYKDVTITRTLEIIIEFDGTVVVHSNHCSQFRFELFHLVALEHFDGDRVAAFFEGALSDHGIGPLTQLWAKRVFLF
eukprot:Lithocolla_globosa_v1_NODE_3617_length_1623_cov_4.639031.p2 type:complete len:113 gc:universal NODE_3617_length_1623_cov_4.639031:1152-1490(+)